MSSVPLRSTIQIECCDVPPNARPSSFLRKVAFKDAFCGSNPLEFYSAATKVGVMPEILPGAGRPNNLKRLDQVYGILMSSSASAFAQN